MIAGARRLGNFAGIRWAAKYALVWRILSQLGVDYV